MRLPYSVQVFLVAKKGATWTVLLLQRRAHPDLMLPDFWQGVTGALESGESFDQTAIREVLEETSIKIKTVTYTGFEQAFPIKPEWRKSYGNKPSHVQERTYFAVLPEAITPALSVEHKRFLWCSESEALELLTFGNNGQCLRSVYAALATRGA